MIQAHSNGTKIFSTDSVSLFVTSLTLLYMASYFFSHFITATTLAMPTIATVTPMQTQAPVNGPTVVCTTGSFSRKGTNEEINRPLHDDRGMMGNQGKNYSE